MKTIGDAPLSIFDVAALVEAGDAISLSESAYRRIDDARKIVETYAAGDEPVYGLNTGLGGNLGFRISVEDIRAFQEQLILGRNIGVGEPLAEPVCRAAAALPHHRALDRRFGPLACDDRAAHRHVQPKGDARHPGAGHDQRG